MNNYKANMNQAKKVYEAPVLEVTQVVIERTIAESGVFRVSLDEWEVDTTPDASYDGDIWMSF
jgi:hypothetical protein